MKFRAYDAYVSLLNHFKKYNKYYLKSKMRQRDKWGRKTVPELRTQMWATDWGHYIHHIFNMFNYDYNKERFIYGELENNIHFNLDNLKHCD